MSNSFITNINGEKNQSNIRFESVCSRVAPEYLWPRLAPSRRGRKKNVLLCVSFWRTRVAVDPFIKMKTQFFLPILHAFSLPTPCYCYRVRTDGVVHPLCSSCGRFFVFFFRFVFSLALTRVPILKIVIRSLNKQRYKCARYRPVGSALYNIIIPSSYGGRTTVPGQQAAAASRVAGAPRYTQEKLLFDLIGFFRLPRSRRPFSAITYYNNTHNSVMY